MNIKLTKDSDALICLLYKQYLYKRKNGVSKADAKDFGSSLDIQATIAQKWTPDDVDETCWELDRAGLLECFKADCIAYQVQLSDQGIIYMENCFKDGLENVIDHLNKIKSLLPI